MLIGAIIALLLAIFVQDLRNRAVLWMLFPAVFGLCMAWNPHGIDFAELGMSVAFITFLLLSLTLYLSLRQRKLVRIWEGFFSLGDILFLVAITPLFTWMGFVYFFTIGTILTLVLHLVIASFSSDKSIPYAGYLSLITIGYVLFPDVLHQLIVRLSGN